MKRETGLDLLRTFAILFVVGVHFFLNSNFYKEPVSGNSMMMQVALRWLFMICVPLFILLTGYLQTEKKAEMKYFKKIIPILGVYLFYSVLSILMRIIYLNEDKSTITWVADILVFEADKYSWYINMFIGLFLLTPFLNLIHKNLNSKKNYKIFLLVLILLTGFPAFFTSISNHYSILRVLKFSNWWTGIYPVTYYFIGAYIREYQPKPNIKLASLCLITVILFETFVSVILSRHKVFISGIGGYDSIAVMIEAVLFFLIFYDKKIDNTHISGLFGTISKLSLDIYLCTYITDKLIYTYVMKNLFVSQQQIFNYFAFIVMTSFTAAFFIAYLRYKVVRLKPIQDNKHLKSTL